MQTMSLRGLMELAGHEAIVPQPYFDGGGVLTWGLGHTAGAGSPLPTSFPMGTPSPIADVLKVFRTDLAHYEAQVRAAFTRPLTDTEFDAALSFHFNTGAIGYATWVKKFNAGDRAGAVAAIMSWTTPASIKGRRKKEQLLFDKGIYSNGERANVYSTDGRGHIVWSSGKSIDLRPILDPAPPIKLPPAPMLIPTNSKPVQPASLSGPAPTLAIAIKPAPAKPIGFWARLKAFLHL
jgi:lysozyme